MKRHNLYALYALYAASGLLLLALPAFTLPIREEVWIAVHTASFTLFSDAGERRTRQIGADLERLRDALAQLSPGLTLTSPVPTFIYVFQDRPSFQPYQRLYNGQPVDSGGYFLGRQFANYIAINGDQPGDGRALIYHEYLHYVMNNNYSALPLWLHEGLAEYYSTFQVSAQEAEIGQPVAAHVLWLRQHEPIPLATLFAVNDRSPEYNETSRRGDFYAESWALVHYLLTGNPERRQQTAEYLRLARTGMPADQILAKTFGTDPAPLERELRAYLRRHVFAVTRVPIRAEANLAMESNPMAWPDVLTRLGELLLNLGDDRRTGAEEHFRAALALRPDDGSALAGLGLLEERAEHAAAARPYYEKAAKLAPDDAVAQFLYARNLLDDPGPDSLRLARAALARAVALRPEFGEAWARLGYTYQSEETLPPAAVQAMETAHRLLPSRMDVAHNLALAYARTGQTAKAEELIERVLAPQASPEEVADAREALLDEEQRHAEELIDQQKFDEALPLLQAVQAKTSRPGRREELAHRIAEIQHALSFNSFVQRYNEAVELANRGNIKEALAILQPLLTATQDPAQIDRARALIEHLKPAKKR